MVWLDEMVKMGEVQIYVYFVWFYVGIYLCIGFDWKNVCVMLKDGIVGLYFMVFLQCVGYSCSIVVFFMMIMCLFDLKEIQRVVKFWVRLLDVQLVYVVIDFESYVFEF